jgi:hypothetical protein
MPVRKFRNIEEMNEFDRQRWQDADARQRAGRLFAIYALAHDTVPPLNMPKGVHKFRSIEEMNAFRRRYEDERIERLRAMRINDK